MMRFTENPHTETITMRKQANRSIISKKMCGTRVIRRQAESCIQLRIAAGISKSVSRTKATLSRLTRCD